MKFNFSFLGTILACLDPVRIPNPDPDQDPLTHLNPDTGCSLLRAEGFFGNLDAGSGSVSNEYGSETLVKSLHTRLHSGN